MGERLRAMIRDAVERTFAGGQRPVEPWLRRGLVLGALFFPGARIEALPETSGPEVLHAGHAENGIIPDASREALRSFATGETHAEPGVFVLGPLETLPSGALSEIRVVTDGDLERVEPLLFDAGVYQIVLRRDFPASEFPTGKEWDVVRVVDSAGDVVTASRTENDRYGNGIYATRVFSPDGLSVHETISVLPRIPFDTDADPRVVPLNVDLQAFGSVDVNGAFLTMEAPLYQRTEHFSMHGYEDLVPEARELVAAQDRPLRDGLDDAARLFGEPHTPIQNILLMGGYKGAAGVMYFQPDVVRVHVEFLAEVQKHPSEFMRMVARHEGLHAFDARYRFSQDTLMRGAFLLMPDDGFVRLNESSVYPYGFGGHSDENAGEFFASFVNSLVRPEWERWIVVQPEDFRKAYVRAAEALQSALHAETDVPGEAPIRSMLEERVRFLKIFG